LNRRLQIAMSEEEVGAFLVEQRVMACATRGVRGWPHVMPLWYVLRGGEIWGWTYAKSQKARNLERDDRATLQLEAGDRYEELRGVMIEAHAVVHRDTETVVEVGREILERYATKAPDESFMDVVRAQAAKRIALQFVPARIASWDHRKLGGGY
jgi:nitroimidazol reductase NimA-like FMN-containing flavoprotein (pyridoxamine 5'-phosphate oxidase superfamily)